MRYKWTYLIWQETRHTEGVKKWHKFLKWFITWWSSIDSNTKLSWSLNPKLDVAHDHTCAIWNQIFTIKPSCRKCTYTNTSIAEPLTPNLMCPTWSQINPHMSPTHLSSNLDHSRVHKTSFLVWHENMIYIRTIPALNTNTTIYGLTRDKHNSVIKPSSLMRPLHKLILYRCGIKVNHSNYFLLW